MSQSLFKRDQALFYEFDGETVKIEPWGKDSFRVRAVYMGEILESDFALLPQKKSEVDILILIEEMYAEITNGRIKAVIEINDFNKRGKIKFLDGNGDLLLQEVDSQGALNIHARHFKPNLGGDYQLTVEFEPNKNEKLYGMGQYQQELFDIKNCHFELAHRNSQASVPFVLSSRGYGFFWHNPAIGEASFGKNKTWWRAYSTKQMDYWISAGEQPAQIVEAYGKATGTAPMMPEYGLGFWQCKLRYYNQEQLLSVARKYKKHNIPIDVIVCDFFHWPKMGDFRFDEEFFPNPQAMVDELKEMGIELMVSVWPQIALDSENFQEMRQKGLLVKSERGVNVNMQFGGDSVFYDATNPKARDYVWQKCKRNYYELGIKIFWLDEAEPEYGVYDFDNYRYHIGSNLQVGNIYPQLYSRNFYEGMEQECQENIVNLVRCAWAGSQRYGALVWSGDIQSTFESFRRQICAGLHMGISGIPWWTTDIGGFHGGDPNDEGFRNLLVRWFQYGTFCPVMRLHGDRKPQTNLFYGDGRTALFTGGDNEIWSFGEDVYVILKKYIQLREKMRPYVRRLMREASEKGAPVMRTMFYEFPEDTICWDLSNQYMFGNHVLVAPIVYEKAFEREVYLPQAKKWIDMHTGKVYEGGRFIMVEAPLEKIPVFIAEDCDSDLFHLWNQIDN